MISLQDLGYCYPRAARPALTDVRLEVARGEQVAIVGASGSGKTTLMSVLGLLTQPSFGRYVLDGRDVTKLSLGERAQLRGERIGFVFQHGALLAHLTLLENVLLPLEPWPELYRAAVPRAHELLCRVGLSELSHHYPHTVSGGQAQRVAVARALIRDPELILADEPTGSLDEANADAVMALLAGMRSEGKTLLVVTHSARVAAAADRSIVVDGGRLSQAPLAAAA